jgi:hypothetical protein
MNNFSTVEFSVWLSWSFTITIREEEPKIITRNAKNVLAKIVKEKHILEDLSVKW